MEGLPQWFTYAIGFLFLTNLGLIWTILHFIGKSVWWASKIDSKIEHAYDMAVRAHKRIDTIKGEPCSKEN